MERRVKSVLRALHEESDIFFLVSDEEIRHIAPCLEEVHFPAGTVVFNEGDPPDAMALVASGKIEVKKATEFQGSGFVVAQVGGGSLLGELSFSDGQGRSASAVALEDSVLLLMSREALERITLEHPEAALKIYRGMTRILALRLRKLTERLAVVF